MTQYVNTEFTRIDPDAFKHPVVNPAMSFYFDSMETDGSVSFVWNIYPKNTEGYELSTDNMYFNFYINNEKYGWEPSSIGIESNEEILYDIPLSVNSANVQYFFGMLFVSIFTEAPETISSNGLQVFYKGPSDTYSSDLVTAECEFLSSLTELESDDHVSIHYYDLCGRPVNNPASGLYIRVRIDQKGNKTIDKIRF